jgi:hypothetical protein
LVLGEPCWLVLEVVRAFASSHCVMAREAGIEVVVPKGLVTLAPKCFCRLSVVSIVLVLVATALEFYNMVWRQK